MSYSPHLYAYSLDRICPQTQCGLLTRWSTSPKGQHTSLLSPSGHAPLPLHSEDISALVNKQQFIASFNIPFFADISAVSGYDSHGFNYTTDPRSEIFQRDHSKVVDLTSMKALMNSNDYKHDPLARGSPCNQISARCDLPALDNSSTPYAFGGIDCKVVGMQDVREQRVHVAGGQTHDNVPVFAWREWEGVAHHGMPPVNNFSFVQTSPQTAATRAFYRGADMSYVAVEVVFIAVDST